MPRVTVRDDGHLERRVLIGLLTDTAALAKIAPRWKREGLLKSPWANMLAQWAVDHYGEYKRAPGATIQAIFESWASTGNRSDEEVERIGEFLGSLSDQYETLSQEANTEYTLDLTARYFDKVKALRLRETIERGLEAGRLDRVLQEITSFRRTDLASDHFIDVLRSPEAVEAAFTQKQEPVIRFQGALGEFWGDSLERDGFVVLLAPSKRYKSACMLDLCWHGLLQRRKIAFFQAGDLSQAQIMRRFIVRAARRPWSAGTVKYPRSIRVQRGERFASVEHEEMVWDSDISQEEGLRAFEHVLRNRVRSPEAHLLLSCHSAGSLSVTDIESHLEEAEKDGWVPDVICIDYTDILAACDHRLEKRDQINETWMRLRALSSNYHCLVLSATQTNAEAYRAETVRKYHFSDDRRKNDHVTGMVAISMTDAEKNMGILRHDWIDQRERQETRTLHVAGCRALMQPYILASWGEPYTSVRRPTVRRE